MCGIFGYIGPRSAQDVLISGLKKQNQRGYDSAGIATNHSDEGLKITKIKGDAGALEAKLLKSPHLGTLGLGHTRWATHGEPSEVNAHPHTSCVRATSPTIVVVHNGTIDNFQELKTALIAKGHIFTSETDTEVIAHAIEEVMKEKEFIDAVCQVLLALHGTFGLLIHCTDYPRTIIAANFGSEMVIAHSDNEVFIASIPGAIRQYADKSIELQSGQIAIITDTDDPVIQTFKREVSETQYITLEGTVEDYDKGIYPHFTLKEIMESPKAAESVMRGRLDLENGNAVLGAPLPALETELITKQNVRLFACGTAFYASQTGALMLRQLAKYNAHSYIASEVLASHIPFKKDLDFAMVLSQSGTTIDTIDALNEAKDQGLITLGIVNEVGSKITRINHAGIYTHSGPEIGVASTKVYVAQIIACAVLTLRLARQRGMSPADGQELIVAMQNLPKQIEEVLKLHELIKTIACEYQCAESIQTLGRSYDAFSAAELALKITELSYIPTSDFPGGEMKHGPIAMVEPGFPVFAIVTQRSQRAKMHSNIIEVKSRGAEVIIFGHADDEEGRRLAKYFIPIPETLPCLSPVLTAPAIHLLAYELGVAVHELGVAPDNSVDNPRNLAKTVTVR